MRYGQVKKKFSGRTRINSGRRVAQAYRAVAQAETVKVGTAYPPSRQATLLTWTVA
jgi:hypothetical protein